MDYFYLFALIVIFTLAISDLVVGVGNDAVNFLNSAIGSKTASIKVIIAVAILGVLIGATFSGGMMEIARKGMFYPEKFLFTEIMVVFLAVMFADVILLDFFNTAGLPTSTTVSIVFELLGSAFAVALFKTISTGADLSGISQYINSSKALGILSGILLSVIVAFTFGVVIQYIVRIFFTFNWEKTCKYYAPLWGGFSISAITYFLLIKGAKGASFTTPEMLQFISHNTFYILLISFIAWTVLLQVLSSLFKFNILKVIVLFGTFALAMAFAGNDLVNFIGVPLAAYDAFKIMLSQGFKVPDLFMGGLNQAVKTPTIFLLAAGIIMSLTLCFSRKARSVVKTSVDLSRQTEGNEKFSSNQLSRSLVRVAINVGDVCKAIVPGRVQVYINKRFKTEEENNKKIKEKDKPAFDMVRASVNLVVASALIAMGTSLKLPLSTTYVTFMVAMGTSLSDRAWGRESAVFRISGVITVIGGWLFTGIMAFSMAFLIAAILYYGGIFTLVAMIIISIILMYRTYIIHSKKEKKEEKAVTELDTVTKKSQIAKCNVKSVKFLRELPIVFNKTIFFMIHQKRSKLKKTISDFKDVTKEIKDMRSKAPYVIKKFEDEYIAGLYYIQVLDYMKEISDALVRIQHDIWEYIDNNHPAINHEQVKDLKILRKEFGIFILKIIKSANKKETVKISPLEKTGDELHEKLEEMTMAQIIMVKKNKISSRNSLLITNLFHEMKNIVIHSIKFTKALNKLNLAGEKSK
ncbi:MAG TPA: phosphate permease [Lentisphaeria bacterium]|nr:MAG: hypothetical protein A2X47_14235 [Lentisphaerae bacterium GWF2_38_69]HBM15852.1 phosphate permease [Lentisphaeria bacterium]